MPKDATAPSTKDASARASEGWVAPPHHPPAARQPPRAPGWQVPRAALGLAQLARMWGGYGDRPKLAWLNMAAVHEMKRHVPDPWRFRATCEQLDRTLSEWLLREAPREFGDKRAATEEQIRAELAHGRSTRLAPLAGSGAGGGAGVGGAGVGASVSMHRVLSARSTSGPGRVPFTLGSTSQRIPASSSAAPHASVTGRMPACGFCVHGLTMAASLLACSTPKLSNATVGVQLVPSAAQPLSGIESPASTPRERISLPR